MNKTPPKPELSEKIQILIVEDERIIAINLKESLESLGYEVVAIASSGRKAIEKARLLSPDLVLMDIRLKGAMDGIEAAEQIWDNLQIPVIYVTGHSDRTTLERAKITAPFGYVIKPIKERELSVAIEIALQRYEREHLLTAILKGMGDGVIVVDKTCHIKSLNQMAEILTGWRLSDARNRQLGEVFKLIDEQTQYPIDNPIKTALQYDTTAPINTDTQLLKRNGTTLPISGNISPIKDNKGVITGAVLVFRDMSDAVAAATQRKRVEEAIRQQLEHEKKLNQFQSQIIRTISHEYRTPLSIILACSQLLERNTNPLNEEKHFRNCQKIQSAVKYMVGLLENVLTFNQFESHRMAFSPIRVNLEEFCNQLIEEHQFMSSEHHEIHFNLISAAPECTAYLDEKLLQQILGNLLSNAIKYSPEGGTIQLAITCENNQVLLQV
ncbi:MAG TPA: response regulator, partial [Coleofasciculaceae cyanobacterium]